MISSNRNTRQLRAAIFLTFGFSMFLFAEERNALVSYDLKVSIEPGQGEIAVQGKVEFDNPGSHNFKFNLHETFAITKLLVNGKVAGLSFAPAEFSPMTPAAKVVVVSLPLDLSPGKIRMEIAYVGRLKKLPEFGAAPDQTPSMDDQVNSHLVELAGFSSWYPQFSFGGVPVRAEFELSLPQGWISIGSGKKLDEHVNAGRADHSLVLPQGYRPADCGISKLPEEILPPIGRGYRDLSHANADPVH